MSTAFILLFLLVLTHGLCWLLGRGLGMRLDLRAGLLAILLLGGFFSPWFFQKKLLVPTAILSEIFPDFPKASTRDPHFMLNDSVYQFIPWELQVRKAFSEARLPLWSDVLEGGSSPWLNPQARALSLVAALSRLAPIRHFLLVTLALDLLIAFEGCILLLRRLGRSRTVAFLAAFSFAWGGGMMAWALFPHTGAMAWVPWLVLALISLWRRPTARGVAMTSLITALLLLAGHPEIALLGISFAGLCGFFFRQRRAGVARGLAGSLLGLGIGFCLAAPQWLPFLLHVPASQRAHEMIDARAAAGDFALHSPATWFHSSGTYFISPANPWALGVPYQEKNEQIGWPDVLSPYAGLASFAGALIALGLRRRGAYPFLGFAACGLLLASGFAPLMTLLYKIPLLRLPAYIRLLPLAGLALALAGAFGLDAILRSGKKREIVASAVAVSIAAVLSLLIRSTPAVIALWCLFAGSLAAAGLGKRKVATVGLCLVALLDLIPWSRTLLPHGDRSFFFPQTPFTHRLASEVGDRESWRITGGDFLAYPSLLSVYGLADIRPHNPLAPQDQLRVLNAAFGFNPTTRMYFSPLRNLDHPLLDFLGVRVVYSSVALPLPRRLVDVAGGAYLPWYLLRNPHALPRFFVPREVEVIEQRDLEAWISRMADARKIAVFRTDLPEAQLKPFPALPDAVAARVVRYRPGEMEIEVPGSGFRLLASSLPFPAGWIARGETGRLKTVTVDGAYLGVSVPADTRRIRISFEPPGFRLGVALFGLGAGALLFLLSAPRRVQGARRGPRPARERGASGPALSRQ